MRANNPDLFRPLAASAQAGDFDVRLRQGALRCARCGRTFRQHDAEESADGGVRFVCECGLDALEVTPA